MKSAWTSSLPGLGTARSSLLNIPENSLDGDEEEVVVVRRFGRMASSGTPSPNNLVLQAPGRLAVAWLSSFL